MVDVIPGIDPEPPPGYAKSAALRRALDRGLAAWRVDPERRADSLSLETLRAALLYLQAGYRVDSAHLTLIFRAALFHGAGYLTALGFQRDAEAVAEIVAEALLAARVPLALNLLWRMQGAAESPKGWQVELVAQLRARLPQLSLRRRAHIAAAIHQLETGLPVMEPSAIATEIATEPETGGDIRLITAGEYAEDGEAVYGQPRRRGTSRRGFRVFWAVMALIIVVAVGVGVFRFGPYRDYRGVALVTVPGGYYSGFEAADATDTLDTSDSPDASEATDTTENAAQVYVTEFRIMATEVTNRAYRECVEARACRPPVLPHSAGRTNYFLDATYDLYPVVMVRWQDAADYCAWREMRLPSVAEWETAAGYSPLTDRHYRFPWGDQFDARFANSAEGGHGDTQPVGAYHPHGDSPLGVRDLTGNVAEWTSSPGLQLAAQAEAESFGDDPNAPVQGTGAQGTEVQVMTMQVKGGSFLDGRAQLEIAAGLDAPITTAAPWLGFRCVA